MESRFRPHWARNFVGALATLVFLKYAQVVNNLWGTEPFDPVLKLLAKSLLLLGSDILGAAVVGLLACLVALPALVLGMRRLSVALFLVVQVAHAALAILSVMCTIHQGGPLNKQVIDLTLFGRAGGGMGQDRGLWLSMADYVTWGNLTFVAATFVVAIAATAYGPRLIARLKGPAKRWVVRLLTVETAITMIVVPFLLAGTVGGARIYAYGLEKSPGVEFVRSYVSPVVGRFFASEAEKRGDPFRFDLSARYAETDPPDNPLENARPRRTNVVIVLLESIGEPYLDWPQDPMPYLKSLRQRPGAVALRAHYSTWSLTTKALFSLLCSEQPYPTYKPISYVNPTIPCLTLSEVLHDAGYFTAFISGQDLAYDRQMRFFRHRKLDVIWDERNMPGESPWKAGPWGLDDRQTVQTFFKLVDEKRDAPFFVLMGTVAGHHPFDACQEHLDNPLNDRVKSYLRALRFADDRVRDVVEGLEARGRLDDTMVVIVSDHGDGHGRHVGRNVYESVIRVPMAILAPQLGQHSGQIGFTTSHVDIAPTLLSLLGLPVPCTMKGRDLTRDTTPRIALLGGRPPKFQIGISDGPWKYILQEDSIEMLYHIADDPEERNNLIDAHPEIGRALSDRVEAWTRHSQYLIEDYTAVLDASGCQPFGAAEE